MDTSAEPNKVCGPAATSKLQINYWADHSQVF